MDTIALWEAEIEEDKKRESLLKEEAIYNFYGDVESVEEGVVDTLNTIKEKVKNAIIKVIDMLNDQLSKGKDNKIKSFLKNLLTKAKNLLTKTDKISSKDEAKEIIEEGTKIRDEAAGIGESLKEAVEKKDKNRITAHIYTMGLNLGNPSAFDNAVNYAKKNMDNFIEPDDGSFEFKDKKDWDQDYFDMVLSAIVSNPSQEKIDLFKKVRAHLYAQ